MPEKIRITAIGGSLEALSTTRLFMDFAAKELISIGAIVDIFDVRESALPYFEYRGSDDNPPESLVKLLNTIRISDGFLFASPEYHGTVSGAFKNVIDYFEYLSNWVPPYITGKPAGLIAVAGAESAGSGTLNTMISMVHSLRGIVVPASMAIGSANKQISSGREIKNEQIKRRLKRLSEELFTMAAKLK